MRINLSYGRSGLDVELPDTGDITVFRTKSMPTIGDPSAEVRRCLEQPIGCPSLEDIAAGKKSACVVVSDITRPAPNKSMVPPILETLQRAGIGARDIHLVIATGIHHAPTPEELAEILGAELPAEYPVVSHDARDPSTVSRIGVSSRGTPMEINRLYLESDVKVVTGLVEPHFMAGYSGGRKSVAVGLASVETVKALHGTRFLEHPGARNCELAANPLHAELTEIAITAGADFCVNAVIDAERRVGGIFCGDIVSSHIAACDFVERYCTIRVDAPFDIVVTTSAGYPLDTTYYQAVKGLVGAMDILSPDSGIVLASECSKGLGSSDFREMLQKLNGLQNFDDFLKHISDPDNFVIDQWEVEMLVKALRKSAVYLYSTGIPQEDWPLTCATQVETVEAGLALAAERSAKEPRIAVIPEGPYVIPLLGG